MKKSLILLSSVLALFVAAQEFDTGNFKHIFNIIHHSYLNALTGSR